MLWKVCEQVGYDACELHFKSVKDTAKYLQLKEVVESGDAGDHCSRHPQLFCPVTRNGFQKLSDHVAIPYVPACRGRCLSSPAPAAVSNSQ